MNIEEIQSEDMIQLKAVPKAPEPEEVPVEKPEVEKVKFHTFVFEMWFLIKLSVSVISVYYGILYVYMYLSMLFI